MSPSFVGGHFQTTFANLNVIMMLRREGVLGCDVSIDHKFRHAQEGAWHTNHAGKLILWQYPKDKYESSIDKVVYQ